MERKLTILHYVLLVLSLGMVAGSLVANHELSQFLADVNPAYAQSVAQGPRSGLAALRVGQGSLSGPAGSLPGGRQGTDRTAGPALQDGQEPGLRSQESEEKRQSEILRSAQNDTQSAQNDAQSAQNDSRSSTSRLLDSSTPRVPNMVHLVARHADGTIFYDQTVHNLRTNAGINWQYGQMAGTPAAACTYLALSNDSGMPAATDTAVVSEITTNGLARAAATPAHSNNASSYTLTYTFTATGTQSAQKAGLLNASSGGTLCFENTFSAVAMNSGDTLQVVWTLNF